MNTLCFDIGGTYIKYGVFNGSEKLIDSGKFPTPKNSCKDTIPNKIIDYTREILNSYNLEKIGISTAGQVDAKIGKIIYANDNLPDYTNCNLAEKIQSQIGVETYVENDAYCAALGEMYQGAAINSKSFICLTLGTGVGGAFILNQKLYKGSNNSAAIAGYLSVNNSYFDKTVSTKGILDHYKILTGREVDGIKLFQKIRNLEKEAVIVYENFINNMVLALLNITYMFDPELIVIGGGISSQGQVLFDDINVAFQEKVLPVHNKLRIVKAHLENTAGLIGAYYITKNRNYHY
ncbi:ROK family protein [Francisella sp. 19X1-34]|uniref:ROK family protein n=1 Tax=Francisella sp. 19X1-34 TaxID=3087177 RepID=UPI002E31DD5E|nr:ROK family protein [Francisella sp. 19X1-34]MED7789206.1 ROK family protein [Francisella sp. 19X1-34]